MDSVKKCFICSENVDSDKIDQQINICNKCRSILKILVNHETAFLCFIKNRHPEVISEFLDNARDTNRPMKYNWYIGSQDLPFKGKDN